MLPWPSPPANFGPKLLVVSVAVAVPLASWGTTAATRVPRLRIGDALENGQEGSAG